MTRFAHILLSACLVPFSAGCVLPGAPTTYPEPSATSPSTVQAEPAPPPPPHLGDDPAKIEAYLRGLQIQVEKRRLPYADVRLRGTDEELAALEEQIDHVEQRFNAERERLWPGETQLDSEVMAITGGVLTGVGCIGGALGIAATVMAEKGWATFLVGLGTGVGTLGFLAPGIPMLVIGAQQVPRKPSRYISPTPVSLRFGADGVALAGSF